MKFGRWIPLAEAVAPDGPGVLEARVESLIEYPRGKSAMVHYDGGDSLAAALDRLRAIATIPLWVRFATVEKPQDQLARLLRDFEDRFGEKPTVARAAPARR